MRRARAGRGPVNGDGVGDFRGIMRRLDYLDGLGVTAVWIMPFQKSPDKDHGYDITDYYSVDPRYGTLGDFVDFTHGCKQRGMRVLIDLVVNHTSALRGPFCFLAAGKTSLSLLPGAGNGYGTWIWTRTSQPAGLVHELSDVLPLTTWRTFMKYCTPGSSSHFANNGKGLLPPMVNMVEPV